MGKTVLCVVAAVLLSLLAGCATEGPKTPLIAPQDQHPPMQGYRTEFMVHVNIVKAPEDIAAVCRRQGPVFVVPEVVDNTTTTLKIGACSKWDESNRKLTMWVRSPRYLGDTERFAEIGYMLSYGVAGNYHEAWEAWTESKKDEKESSLNSRMHDLLNVEGFGSKTPLIAPQDQHPPMQGYRTEFMVRIYPIDPETDIAMVCIRQGSSFVVPVVVDNGVTRQVRQIGGCSKWSEERRELTMWVRLPSYLEDVQYQADRGHELWHGVAGDLFHKPWDAKQ